MYLNMKNIILAVCSWLRYPLNNKLIEMQYGNNIKAWKILKNEGYINDQRKLKGIEYGRAGRLGQILFFDKQKMTAADNSCEVIAVYNVLNYFNNNYEVLFPDLLKYFSEKGICFGGKFGTDPCYLKSYFIENEYEIGELFGRKINNEKLYNYEKEYDAYIFTTLNKAHNLFSMVHTMFIEKTENGFKIHNDYEGNKEYDNLYSAVTGYNEGKGQPLYLLGIRKPRETVA